MFGQNYSPVESTPSVDCGYYKAKIVSVELKQNSVGQYLAVEVAIEGHPDANPKFTYLNDYPSAPYGSLTLEQSQRIWNQNMTKFFDNFKINRGDFNYPMWVNHVGEVTVRLQKNNPQYKELVLWHDKIEQKKAETPSTSASTNQASIQSINQAAGLPEDIPF